MTGTLDKIVGTVKEAIGKITGNTRTTAEGRTDQAKGDVKNAATDARGTAQGVGDSLKKE